MTCQKQLFLTHPALYPPSTDKRGPLLRFEAIQRGENLAHFYLSTGFLSLSGTLEAHGPFVLAAPATLNTVFF